MAEVLQDSPYANKLPRPYNQVQDGLGYSRHYAQRIRDMGKNSKDTWIKKLWNHMFQSRQNKGNVNARDRDALFGQDSFRSKSRGLQLSRGRDPESFSPAGRKSKAPAGDKHRDSNDKKDEFYLRRGKTLDESEMKRSQSKHVSPGNAPPNLPPIPNGSPHMVTQRAEHERQLDGRVVKTRTTPSSAFMQTAVETLYSDPDLGKEETEFRSSRRKLTPSMARGEDESSPTRSRSVKQNAFMREKTLAVVSTSHVQPHPPPNGTQQSVIYPKSTKSADKRYEQSRVSSKQTPAATVVSSFASHHKPRYDNVVEGREKTIENRSPTRDSPPKHLNKYERKLKRLQDRYDGNRYLKPQKSHPYLESKSFLGRGGEEGKAQRNLQTSELEKKAKALVEKAMKDNKIFSVDGPYPVDTYVRISLRRRGWVEKFGNKGNNASLKASYSGRADTETEEDFDAICGQEVPAPWEEENGLYAISSRLVRQYPAKFIWGGKNLNSMVLRGDVITNHFPKARLFSSKTGLTTSLRELMWINSGDSSSFFPRCYTLCSDEQDDLIEDFRLTACMGLLKWVLKMYVSKKHRDKFREMLVRRENTKYEEVKFDCSGEEDNGVADITEEEEPEGDEEEEEEEDEGEEEEEEEEEEDGDEEDWEDVEDEEEEKKHNRQKHHKGSAHAPRAASRKTGKSKSRAHSRAASRKSGQKEVKEPKPPAINFDYFDEDYESDFEDETAADSPKGNTENGSEVTEKSDGSSKHQKPGNSKGSSRDRPKKGKNAAKKGNTKTGHGGSRKSGHVTPVMKGGKPAALSRSNTTITPRRPPSPSRLPNIRPAMPSRSNTVASIPLAKPKGQVMPDLKKEKPSKKGGEVPLKAVDWAIYVLDKHIKGKHHEDIDAKSKNLTTSQWSQLLKWCHQVAHEGATVPNMTEGKLKESDALLKQMKRLWPQYDIDGKRNMWIVKPGDKSKGIGIEFASKLEDIVKYVHNATTAGTYIMQKYIERPLLICNCKFDLRQWFIVTEWNPLTVWFYGECYLRICSQQYTVNNMHEAVHLSNVSVQQNYLNGKRDSKLPDNNFMTSTQFIKLLDEEGKGYIWKKIVVPGMKEAIVSTLVATQDVTENRKNAFELYGADFILTEDYRPFLLEINSSPGMAPTSVEKARLCSTVIDDTIKVVLDKKENKNADTGGFELIFKDNSVGPSKCVDTKFIVEGQKVKKSELAKFTQIDQEETKKMQDLQLSKNLEHYIKEKSSVKPPKTKGNPPTSKSKNTFLPKIKVASDRCEEARVATPPAKSPVLELPASEAPASAPVPYPLHFPEDLSDAYSLNSLDQEHKVAGDKPTKTGHHSNRHADNEQKENDKPLTPPDTRRGRVFVNSGRVSSRKPKNVGHNYSGNPYHDRHSSTQTQKQDGGFTRVKRLSRVQSTVVTSRRKSALLTEERIREKERIYTSMLSARLSSSHDGI